MPLPDQDLCPGFICTLRSSALPTQQSAVAWQYDVDHLYGPVQPVNYNTEQQAAYRGGNTSDVVLNQNQHLIVWMRPAAQPTFRKLWAVIDVPLLAGELPCMAPIFWYLNSVHNVAAWLLNHETALRCPTVCTEAQWL